MARLIIGKAIKIEAEIPLDLPEEVVEEVNLGRELRKSKMLNYILSGLLVLTLFLHLI